MSNTTITVRRSAFHAGVYDPQNFDSWPWAFDFENGCYLSANKRRCSMRSAAKFDTAAAAREFYHGWKHKDRYRLEVVEFKEYVDVPAPKYPEDHPRSILSRLSGAVGNSVYNTAFMWFLGEDPAKLWSPATIKKHTKLLLAHGIDITKPPQQLLQPHPVLHDDEWHLQCPNLSAIK